MRLKIVLAILLPTLAIVGAVIFLKLHPAATVPVVAPASTTASNIAKRVPSSSAPNFFPPLSPPPATLTPEQQQAAIDAEIDRLQEWSMNNDPASLSNILADLTYPDKEVREAAIEAAKQFESTNAIPALKAAAAHAEDNQEAIAMLEAADWLALPTADFQPSANKPQLTPQQQQAINKSRDQAKTRRQEYLQKYHPQNASSSDSQSAPPSANGQNSPTAPNN